MIIKTTGTIQHNPIPEVKPLPFAEMARELTDLFFESTVVDAEEAFRVILEQLLTPKKKTASLKEKK